MDPSCAELDKRSLLDQELGAAQATLEILQDNVSVFARKQALTMSCLEQDVAALFCDPMRRHKLSGRADVPLYIDFDLAIKTLREYQKTSTTSAFEHALAEESALEAQVNMLREGSRTINEEGSEWYGILLS